MRIKIVEMENVENKGDLAFTNVEEKFDGKVQSFKAIYVILPCGHQHVIRRLWQFENYETDQLTVTPSILCNKTCWHGYITKGEFIQV